MAWIDTCVKLVLEITWESGAWCLYGLDKDTVEWLFLALGSRKYSYSVINLIVK